MSIYAGDLKVPIDFTLTTHFDASTVTSARLLVTRPSGAKVEWTGMTGFVAKVSGVSFRYTTNASTSDVPEQGTYYYRIYLYTGSSVFLKGSEEGSLEVLERHVAQPT